MNGKHISAIGFGVAICLAIACALSACGHGTATTIAADTVTQKSVLPGRTPVTVLVKHAFGINAFEAAVEEKFPQIDLVQVGNFTSDMGVAEYEARLKNGDLTDIVMTWPLDVGEDYWSEQLLDLSSLDFTNRYNLSMLSAIERDGSLYYLPGPAQVRGIVYNKTLFAENGWQIPTSFEEFVALCQTIEASGMRSLQLGFGNAEVLDTAFVGYSYADCFSSPQDKQWLANYNTGAGNYASQFAPALDTFQSMIDRGVFKRSDLDVTYSGRETMLFSRQCAMIEDSVLMARMGSSLTGTTDEFALMPFFNPHDGGDWARLYMVCYIGVNQRLAEPQNKNIYELVMQVMEYISTPEGQDALMGDTGAMYSSLDGMQPPAVPEIEALVPALNAGRYAIFPQLQNAQSALREGLADMVRGTATAKDVANKVDEQNLHPPAVALPLRLGNAAASFSLTDTGNFVTDCMRAYSGCDLALFLDNGKDGKTNSRGICAKLYQGEITTADLNRILPDLKSDQTGMLTKVSMTGANLLETLEYAIPINNNETGWFYYFSGLRMEFDAVAQPGSRIRSVTTLDGKAIDSERVYTIAVMDNTVPEQFLLSSEKTHESIKSILENTIIDQKTISPARDGRLTTVVMKGFAR